MAKSNKREKVLSSIADYDNKICKCEEELKTLSSKRQILFARTIEAEMKMRNLDLKYFYSQMDKFDEENKKSNKSENVSKTNNMESKPLDGSIKTEIKEVIKTAE